MFSLVVAQLLEPRGDTRAHPEVLERRREKADPVDLASLLCGGNGWPLEEAGVQANYEDVEAQGDAQDAGHQPQRSAQAFRRSARGSLGSPSTRSPMTFFWISEDPA